MKNLFIAFESWTDFNDAKRMLSNLGFEGKVCQKNLMILEYSIQPEQEIQILEFLDFYSIWVNTYESIDEFLKDQ